MPRILSPYSDPWIAWTMLLLLGLLLFANLFQPGLIRNSFSSAFSIKERDSIFAQSSGDIRAQFCIYIYKFVIIAFALYATLNTEPGYQFITLLKFCGLLVAIYLIKIILILWASTTFFDIKTLKICLKHMANLFNLISIIVYPYTLAILFFQNLDFHFNFICAGIITIFYLICVAIKIFRLFLNSFLSVIYILLYLLILEIVPLALLYFIGKTLIL